MAMNFSTANDIIVKDLNLKKKSDKGNKQSISGLPNGQLGVSASKALTVPQLF
jgi:hypothetical protein